MKLLYHSLQNKPYTINYETLNKDISKFYIYCLPTLSLLRIPMPKQILPKTLSPHIRKG